VVKGGGGGRKRDDQRKDLMCGVGKLWGHNVRFSAQVLTTAEGQTMVWGVDASRVVRKREAGSTRGYLLYLDTLNYWDHVLNELNERMRINGKRYVAFVWVWMSPDPYTQLATPAYFERRERKEITSGEIRNTRVEVQVEGVDYARSSSYQATSL